MAARAIENKWKKLIESFAPGIQAATFLGVMRETKTTLIGGAAVEFSQTSPNWKLRDVDFVCGRAGFEDFCIFLIEKLHGKVIDREEHAELSAKGPSCQTRGVLGRSVIVTDHAVFDILCSTTVTPLTAVAYSYSTHLMVSVSADAVCIAYPSAFFDNIGLVRAGPRSEGPDVQRGVADWETRGFSLVGDVNSLTHRERGGECVDGGYCPRATRFFGDEHCLTFYFHKLLSEAKGGVVDAGSGPNMDWTASWIFVGESCGGRMCERRVPAYCESALIVNSGSIV